MKKYDLAVLKDAANRLLFDMSDEEYKTLLEEFDIITTQMRMIGEDSSLDLEEPMTFPFDCKTTFLREDIPGTPLDREEAIKNANNKTGGQIKLPKVVI